jgi:hypothetical protein
MALCEELALEESVDLSQHIQRSAGITWLKGPRNSTKKFNENSGHRGLQCQINCARWSYKLV